MLTLEQLRAQLADRKLTAVAKGAGVPYRPLWRFVSGRTDKISVPCLQRVSDYLQRGGTAPEGATHVE